MLVEKEEMPPSITSDVLNYLVSGYPQESGYEAGIDRCPIDGHMIPPGTLVKITQKGLQYIEMEANWLILIGPEPMEILSCSSFPDCEVPSSLVTVLNGHTSKVFACAWSPTASLLASGLLAQAKETVTKCTAVWRLNCTNLVPSHGPNTSKTQNGVPNAFVLKHFKGRTNEKSEVVTTLDWKGGGTLLASGSYDGNVRTWGRDGCIIVPCLRDDSSTDDDDGIQPPDDDDGNIRDVTPSIVEEPQEQSETQRPLSSFKGEDVFTYAT